MECLQVPNSYLEHLEECEVLTMEMDEYKDGSSSFLQVLAYSEKEAV